MSIRVGNPSRVGINVATAIQLDDVVESSAVKSGNTGTKANVHVPGTITIYNGADMYYEHIQSSPASTWTVSHNLGVQPNIDVLDSSGNEIIADVHRVNENVATVTFPSPVTGKAVCS